MFLQQFVKTIIKKKKTNKLLYVFYYWPPTNSDAVRRDLLTVFLRVQYSTPKEFICTVIWNTWQILANTCTLMCTRPENVFRRSMCEVLRSFTWACVCDTACHFEYVVLLIMFSKSQLSFLQTPSIYLQLNISQY